MISKPANVQHLNDHLGKRFIGSLISLALLVSGCRPINHGIEIQRSNTAQSSATDTPLPVKTLMFTPTQIPISPTSAPTLGNSSTMIGKDNMVLLYVPTGEFTMGSDKGDPDEKPLHIVNLDAFWIDQTEVTNKQYAMCVSDKACNETSEFSKNSEVLLDSTSSSALPSHLSPRGTNSQPLTHSTRSTAL